MDALTTVKPYSNEIHAQAQLWLKRDPKASYEAWKKCLPARGNPCACELLQFCAGTCVSPDLIRNVLLWSCVDFCSLTSDTILTIRVVALTFPGCVPQTLNRKCSVPEENQGL